MFSTDGYEALGHGVALVSRTDRGVLRLSGADRVRWLQGLVTNDVFALRPGHRLYSAWLTPQGRMIADLWVTAAPEALLLDVPAPLAPDLVARLDRLVFAEDVRIDDVSVELACTLVLGAGASGAGGPVAGAGVLVPDDTYGRPGLVAYGNLDILLDAHGLGTLASAPRVDLDTFDVVRIEAGIPRFLADMTDDTIPLEAGIEDRAISFTKGCYVGQEIIVRVTTRGGGRVARRLVGVTLEGPDRLNPGHDGASSPVAGAALNIGARAVGRLTSVAWSPRLSRVIALGYVHRDFVDPGTRLEVRDGEQSLSAVVTALPFIAPVRAAS